MPYPATACRVASFSRPCRMLSVHWWTALTKYCGSRMAFKGSTFRRFFPVTSCTAQGTLRQHPCAAAGKLQALHHMPLQSAEGAVVLRPSRAFGI